MRVGERQARQGVRRASSQSHQTEDQTFIGKALEKLGMELTALQGGGGGVFLLVPSLCPSQTALASLRQGAVMGL